MATTSELITILQEQYKGWNVDGPRGLLHYLNVAHRMLRQCEADQTVYVDETNGCLPYLATTSQIYNYPLPANCWKLANVLVEVGETGSLLDGYTGADYGMRTASMRNLETMWFGGVEYFRIHQIRSWPCTETVAARLAFMDNPGTTATVYSLKYYKKAADIISDSIQIEVEPPHDEAFLLPAVCKLIEGIQHENYAEARNEIMQHWKPLYWKELNSGEQGIYAETEDRGF